MTVPTMRELADAAASVRGLDVIACLEKERPYVEWRIEAIIVVRGSRDSQQIGPSTFTTRFPFWRRSRKSYQEDRWLAGEHIAALARMKEAGL